MSERWWHRFASLVRRNSSISCAYGVIHFPALQWYAVQGARKLHVMTCVLLDEMKHSGWGRERGIRRRASVFPASCENNCVRHNSGRTYIEKCGSALHGRCQRESERRSNCLSCRPLGSCKEQLKMDPADLEELISCCSFWSALYCS